MRRKSFAKYIIAPSANSPSDALNTPTPFVSGTSLSTSSENSVLSRPTERECTHCKCGHIPNTVLNKERGPDQLNNTLALAASCSNASAEFPTMILTSASCSVRIASCGSPGFARTRIVSFLIGVASTAQEITPHSRQSKSEQRSLEK